MSHVIETVNYKGYKIEISQDTDAESPREWDNLGTIAHWHRNYNFGTNIRGKYDEHEDFKKERERAGDVVLPIYMYDHSVQRLSTESFIGRAHHAEWDSGQVGYIYASKESIKKEYNVKRISKKIIEKVKAILKSEIEVFDQYISGEVFQVITKDENGDYVDSCGGYFGYDSIKEVIEESKTTIDRVIEEQQHLESPILG